MIKFVRLQGKEGHPLGALFSDKLVPTRWLLITIDVVAWPYFEPTFKSKRLFLRGAIMRRMLILCLAGQVCGCATQAGNPYVSASQVISTNGSVYGVPISGAVRVGANQHGLYLQPNLSIRPIRFSR